MSGLIILDWISATPLIGIIKLDLISNILFGVDILTNKFCDANNDIYFDYLNYFSGIDRESGFSVSCDEDTCVCRGVSYAFDAETQQTVTYPLPILCSRDESSLPQLSCDFSIPIPNSRVIAISVLALVVFNELLKIGVRMVQVKRTLPSEPILSLLWKNVFDWEASRRLQSYLGYSKVPMDRTEAILRFSDFFLADIPQITLTSIFFRAAGLRYILYEQLAFASLIFSCLSIYISILVLISRIQDLGQKLNWAGNFFMLSLQFSFQQMSKFGTEGVLMFYIIIGFPYFYEATSLGTFLGSLVVNVSGLIVAFILQFFFRFTLLQYFSSNPNSKCSTVLYAFFLDTDIIYVWKFSKDQKAKDRLYKHKIFFGTMSLFLGLEIALLVFSLYNAALVYAYSTRYFPENAIRNFIIAMAAAQCVAFLFKSGNLVVFWEDRAKHRKLKKDQTGLAYTFSEHELELDAMEASKTSKSKPLLF